MLDFFWHPLLVRKSRGFPGSNGSEAIENGREQ